MSSSISISERLPTTWVATYFRVAFVALAMVLGATAAINATIDPLDRLGNNRFGFFADMERQAKTTWLPRGDYRGVILGSSKPTYIDPASLDEKGFFNASFALAMPEELLAFIDTFVEPGQRLLIGIDLYMFNERSFPLQEVAFSATPSFAELAGYLLSGQVLVYSARDLLMHRRGVAPRLGPDGNLLAERRLQRHRAMTTIEPEPVLRMLETVHFKDFVYSERRIAIMAELRRLLDARGVPHVVFINPLSRQVLDHLAQLPAAPMLDRLRRDLRQLFPELVDLSDSRWSAPENFLRFDVLHYLPEVGAAFVNEELLPRLP